VRIWIDMTAPAHVLVFRPIVRRLRDRGHDVALTARDYSQTVELLELHGMEATVLGRHGGANRRQKAMALLHRTRAMRSFGARRGFDLALAHGSNDLALAAATLRIPAANMFDYEFAVLQHNLGCRLARRVMVPDRIPPERLEAYGVGAGKLVQYPGLKEEYYLHDFQPDPSVLDALGVDRERVVVVFRPPPDVALYHRGAKPLFPRVLDRLGRDEGVHAVVVPRTDEQREHVRGLALPSVIVPDGAVDAQSLIAQADLVISAGGTMNREAIALGTPVYTVFAGKLGGVDEALIREGRLRPLTDPDAIDVRKRAEPGAFERRDPDALVEMFLGTPRKGSKSAGTSVPRSNS
jgi:predicted glycosyltransferase